MAAEDLQLVQDALAASRALQLPQLTSLPAEAARAMDSHPSAIPLNTDMTLLVSILRSHEPPRARLAVRANKNVSSSVKDQETARKESARQALIRGINETLRLEQERGVGTGLARDARWRSHVTEGVRATDDAATRASGNTANAAMAAGVRATAVGGFIDLQLCHIY